MKARKLAKLGKKKVSDFTETLGQHPHHVGMEMSTIEEDRKVPPNIHHFISSNKNHPIHLSEFLHLDKHEDPAKKVSKYFWTFKTLDIDDFFHQNFYRKLKDHPLGCLLEQEFDGDTHKSFTDEQCKSIVLFDNKMFATKTLRINFTMYDVHQDQDVINPCTDHCNVMVHSPDMSPCAHPFWDMFMRHLGGGVGHIDAQATTTVNTSGGPVDEDKDNLGRPNEHGDSDLESEDNDSDLERSLSDGGSNNDLGPDDGEDTDDSDGGYGSM
ncbi:hypothetical protein BT96DRAFT_1006477 [Gymnopus androsaceus JB14]|uniref:Uncharacterized protein n=1 Tax=Gymnopus androsaceus JB14 TaxID=1447944 RepID=A0A6A4GL33_9AGAR|nr:hypothetical protein BT96DRAFT_1006477 [Gymnopus androsaceus JB14]